MLEKILNQEYGFQANANVALDNHIIIMRSNIPNEVMTLQKILTT